MKIKYAQVTPEIARPLIQIKLFFKNRFLISEALIDSGADFCIFPLEAAASLDVPIKKGRKVYLTGLLKGETALYLFPLKLIFDEYTVCAEIGFTQGINPYAPAVLGQKGFFDNFKVCFDKSKLQVEINPK